MDTFIQNGSFLELTKIEDIFIIKNYLLLYIFFYYSISFVSNSDRLIEHDNFVLFATGTLGHKNTRTHEHRDIIGTAEDSNIGQLGQWDSVA